MRQRSPVQSDQLATTGRAKVKQNRKVKTAEGILTSIAKRHCLSLETSQKLAAADGESAGGNALKDRSGKAAHEAKE
jgi:hypothetical protein